MVMMMMVVVVDDHLLLGWHLLLFHRNGRNGEAKRNERRQGNSKLLHGIPPGSRPVVRIIGISHERTVNAAPSCQPAARAANPLVSRALCQQPAAWQSSPPCGGPFLGRPVLVVERSAVHPSDKQP